MNKWRYKYFHLCNKVANDTSDKYIQISLEFEKKGKFDQNVTNVQLDDMFTTGREQSKADSRSFGKKQ